VRPLAEHHKGSSFESELFDVSDIVVMQSQLGPAGSLHTPLSRHQLELKQA